MPHLKPHFHARSPFPPFSLGERSTLPLRGNPAPGFEPGIVRFAPLLVKEEIKAPCPRREDPAPSQCMPRLSSKEESKGPAPSQFMPRLSSKEESKQSHASVQWQRRKQTDSNQESSDSHLFSSKKRSRLLVQEERTLHPRSVCLGSVAKKKARALHPRSLCLGSAAKKKANRVMPLFSGKEESKRIRTRNLPIRTSSRQRRDQGFLSKKRGPCTLAVYASAQ